MRTIVSGVIDAQQSRQVLHSALLEARSTGRPLQVLHAWSTTALAPAGGLDDLEGWCTERAEAQQLAVQLLTQALDEDVDPAPVRAVVQSSNGDPGDLLVRASAEAGLVVVGARSHGALLSAVLGSAATHVLKHAACPVMIVPATVAPGLFRRVVVGLDEEGHAHSALRWAVDAARRHGCPLVILHALPPTSSPALWSTQRRDALHEDDVRSWLATVVDRAAREHSDVPVSLTVLVGSPRAVLQAEAGADDLLVLGSRGHTILAEKLLGAVAVQCTQGATGTTVVVRAGQERLDDPVEVDDQATQSVRV